MSLESASKAESDWMAAVARLGCIVCRNNGRPNTPCHVHHLLSGGRRISHLHTIGLCYGHHESGKNTPELVSRHPWRKAFEYRYGTEAQLLEQTRELLAVVA